MSTDSELSAAYQGFRDTFLDYQTLTLQLRAWTRAFPKLARLQSLGETPEGRELWVLTLGPEPERARPAVWIDANMHASELCGSNVALAIAEDVLRLHLGTAPMALPPHLADTLRDVLVYIMPRISPDGAEQVLHTGRYVRSLPRDERPNQQHSYWRCQDVDDDGLALVMRVQDESGEFVASSEFPGLMLPRELEDEGPYYKIYPEGVIENFDGFTVPAPSFLSDTEIDLNRNFPYSWAPEPAQAGAGAFPASAIESKAIVEFASSHPTIFAWLNLHTFGGVFIRPLGDKPDNEMEVSDLALYRQVGAWAQQYTGYPMVSGFEEFTYKPDTPIHGALSEYAYHQRGCLSYVVELWDLFAQFGATKPKRFVDHYSHLSRADLLKLARWDAEHNQGRLVRPWKKLSHEQLGPVEVGGIDPRFGMWNPPAERLAEICEQHSQCFLRVASLAPRLVCRVAGTADLGQNLRRVDIVVENLGYLPTYILSSAKELAFNEELTLTLDTKDLVLVDEHATRHTIGHLEGWGRGRFGESSSLAHYRSRGNSSSACLRILVRGTGTLKVRVGSCRVGWIDETFTIGV